MRSYRYTCRDCSTEGIVSTSCSAPEPDARCVDCTEDFIEKSAREILEARKSEPVQMEDLVKALIEDYDIKWIGPLKMLSMNEQTLRSILEHRGVVMVATTVTLKDPSS